MNFIKALSQARSLGCFQFQNGVLPLLLVKYRFSEINHEINMDSLKKFTTWSTMIFSFFSRKDNLNTFVKVKTRILDRSHDRLNEVVSYNDCTCVIVTTSKVVYAELSYKVFETSLHLISVIQNMT